MQQAHLAVSTKPGEDYLGHGSSAQVRQSTTHRTGAAVRVARVPLTAVRVALLHVFDSLTAETIE